MPGPGNVGDRVRNLRLTRRMSQAQLAGHDLSDSYVSLIESGKRTPTPAVLRLLAERLGCTTEYLAEGVEPEQRAHLEVLERKAKIDLLDGDPAAALTGFDEVLARSDDADLASRAHWGRAQSLEELGRFEDAIAVFEELREQAEREPTRLSWIPPLIPLTRCYQRVGDLGQAVSLGERVLHRLHELGLVAGPEHTEVGRVLLLAYLDRSDPVAARTLGRRLLAGEQPGGPSLGMLYQRAGQQALDEGEIGEALYFTDQAIAARSTETRRRTQARLRIAVARGLLRGDERPGVRPHSDAALEALHLLQSARADLAGDEVGDCTVDTARAYVLIGQPDRAISAVEAILGNPNPVPAPRSGNGVAPSAGAPRPMPQPLTMVRARVVLAQARLALGDRSAALRALWDAINRLDAMPAGRSAAHVHREIGELFEAAGDGQGAATAYRRALEAAGLRPSPETQAVACDLAGH